MSHEIRRIDDIDFLECTGPIEGMDDGRDLVVACLAQSNPQFLIEAKHLPPAFFDLRTGFAGELLQKLQNYGVRCAAIFPHDSGYGDRFREFLREARAARGFRAFDSREDAVAWLATGTESGER